MNDINSLMAEYYSDHQPHYIHDEDRDCIRISLKDSRYVLKKINDYISIFDNQGEIVGCIIYGYSALLKEFSLSTFDSVFVLLEKVNKKYPNEIIDKFIKDNELTKISLVV